MSHRPVFRRLSNKANIPHVTDICTANSRNPDKNEAPHTCIMSRIIEHQLSLGLVHGNHSSHVVNYTAGERDMHAICTGAQEIGS